jgi:hypothetical protein
MLIALLTLLFGGGSGRPEGCTDRWDVSVDGCVYSMGRTRTVQRRDSVVLGSEFTAKASCGEAVIACGRKRTCTCRSLRDGGTTPPARRLYSLDAGMDLLDGGLR